MGGGNKRPIGSAQRRATEGVPTDVFDGLDPVAKAIDVYETTKDVADNRGGARSSVNCGQANKRAGVTAVTDLVTPLVEAGCAAGAVAAGLVSFGVGSALVGIGCGALLSVGSYLINEHLLGNVSSTTAGRKSGGYSYYGCSY